MSFRILRVARLAACSHPDAMVLDPDMAMILAAIPADISLDVSQLPLDKGLARLRAPARAAPWDDPRPIAVADMSVDAPQGPIPVRVYRSSAASATGIVMNFHGGGWVLGSLDHDDAHCRLLAATTDSMIISVDYRLAPEHPYPAAFDDCYHATRWVHSNRATLGVPEARIAVTGSSAGGNLAAAVAMKARDAGNLPLVLQLLVYPICDCGMDTGSYRSNAEGYFLTAAAMAWFWDRYLPDRQARSHPYVSPLRAPSFDGLPPACIITAGLDPLRDEAELYASRLAAADVPVTVHRFDGLVHGFMKLGPGEIWSRRATDLCADAIDNAFAR